MEERDKSSKGAEENILFSKHVAADEVSFVSLIDFVSNVKWTFNKPSCGPHNLANLYRSALW